MKQILFLIACLLFPFSSAMDAMAKTTQNAYDFSFKSSDGEPMPLAQFKGKLLLVVNTASKCGFTGQYGGLQKLYETYGDRGLVVIAVPSNDFGAQEPAPNDEIKHFCEVKYRVTFPLAAKEIVTGDKAHPFYQWTRSQVGWLAAPKWNFHKYLIGPDGTLLDWFGSATDPDASSIAKAIEANLPK